MPPESPLEKLRRLSRAERDGGGRSSPRADRRSRIRSGGIGAVAVAVLLFLATKGKLVLFFVLVKGKLLLGALKLGPLLTTFSTMALSIWVYANYFGLGLAAGIVGLILVHEIGHGAAARAMRLEVGAPVFIPFFGAVIALKEQPRSTWVESVVGYGGPLFGMLGGLAVLLVGRSLDPSGIGGLLVVIAWFTFLINLFNLTPVCRLDGDRITQPLRPGHWVPGLVLVIVLIAVEVNVRGRPNPFLLFILILGAVKAWRGWRRSRRGEAKRGRLLDRLNATETYEEEDLVPPGRRRAAAVAYFGLVTALTFLLIWSAGLRPDVG